MAVCEARRIKKIKVYSPTKAHRESFAKEMAPAVQAEIIPVDSQSEAVRGVDIIITSTNSRNPFLGPQALGEGVHLSCMQRDEADDDALRRCAPLVVHTNLTENNSTSSQLNEMAAPGFEFRDHPMQRGVDWKTLPTLADLAAGRAKGRERPEQITGFVNNIGLGVQFAAVGAKVFEAAKAHGLGREVPLDWFTQDVHP
jgi:ornithine cyclodeaminase/alanine dehydrogenase-like protein (mu-crystallin family)